jgi:hypothetical protein
MIRRYQGWAQRDLGADPFTSPENMQWFWDGQDQQVFSMQLGGGHEEVYPEFSIRLMTHSGL